MNYLHQTLLSFTTVFGYASVCAASYSVPAQPQPDRIPSPTNPEFTLAAAKTQYDFPKPDISISPRTQSVRQVIIVLPQNTGELEKRYYELAAKHLRERGPGIPVGIAAEAPANAGRILHRALCAQVGCPLGNAGRGFLASRTHN